MFLLLLLVFFSFILYKQPFIIKKMHLKIFPCFWVQEIDVHEKLPFALLRGNEVKDFQIVSLEQNKHAGAQSIGFCSKVL